MRKNAGEIAKEREDFISKLDPKGVEVIDSIVADEAPSNAKTALWCLSKAIEILSRADAITLIGYDGRQELPRGCRIELECARELRNHLAARLPGLERGNKRKPTKPRTASARTDVFSRWAHE